MSTGGEQSRAAAGTGRRVFERIVVAVDGSEPSTWAIQFAARLARATGAELTAVHVFPEPYYSPEVAIPIDELEAAARARGEATMRDQCAHVPPEVPCERVVRQGSAADHIVEAAGERSADLIVLGTHGRGRLARFILGSTAEDVVRRAHCPVMTIGHDPAERHANPPVTPEGATVATGGR